jgi:hypothetical protein
VYWRVVLRFNLQGYIDTTTAIAGSVIIMLVLDEMDRGALNVMCASSGVGRSFLERYYLVDTTGTSALVRRHR